MTHRYLVALAGNPNVGKSTVFNAITGLDQHTGNWPGKTVGLYEGKAAYKSKEFRFVDLPGTYSLRTNSREEEAARDFILTQGPDVTVCVVDATSLERNLNLVLQIIPISKRCVVCLNLMDEAKERGIRIDVTSLQEELGVPVVPAIARRGTGITDLMDTLCRVIDQENGDRPIFGGPRGCAGPPCNSDGSRVDDAAPASTSVEAIESIFRLAERIVRKTVSQGPAASRSFTTRFDDIVTSRRAGIPIMLLLLAVVFAITVSLANYPSMLLTWALFSLESHISRLLLAAGAPAWLHGILVLGTYRTVAWVVSVMLPPMAIFFPLFTLLEDFGYLPRIAFNLDHLFHRSGGHGKQALTMSMGFGCNAAGVVAARIIESPRERLVAILTNNFVPCNGRFPTLIVLSSIFFRSLGPLGTTGPFLAVTGLIATGIGATLLVSKVLSATCLQGVASSFVLELPPYRTPDIWRVIVRSWKDRTVWVLKRAVTVALPCGAVTWVLANVTVGNLSLIAHVARFLNPAASYIGMDGVTLTAFLLGFPANEIVMPIALMSYLSQGAMVQVESLDVIGSILRANGWGWTTALSVLLFSLLHYPCGTTVYTIFKETGSRKWTALSVLIPTAVAVAILVPLNAVFRLAGW